MTKFIIVKCVGTIIVTQTEQKLKICSLFLFSPRIYPTLERSPISYSYYFNLICISVLIYHSVPCKTSYFLQKTSSYFFLSFPVSRFSFSIISPTSCKCVPLACPRSILSRFSYYKKLNLKRSKYSTIIYSISWISIGYI